MGSNIDRENSSGRPTTFTRRGLGGLAIGGGLVASTGKLVFPGSARAEVRRAPSLQELVGSSEIVDTLTGIDEAGIPRSFNLRMHSSAPLALAFSPKTSSEQRASFANWAARPAGTNGLSAADLLITSPENIPEGIRMEPIDYPYKGAHTLLGHFGIGRMGDVAVTVFAPSREAPDLYPDGDLRENGVYPILTSAFARAIASGGTASGSNNGDWDALRQELREMLMVVPKARAEENPTGDRVRELAMTTPVTDSVSRLITRSAVDCPWELVINPNDQEAIAWWINKQMAIIEREGNVNFVGLANPNQGNDSNITVQGLGMGANSTNLGTGLYTYSDESKDLLDLFWAPPPMIRINDKLYMDSIYGSFITGLFRHLVLGKNAGRKFSSAEQKAFDDFSSRFANLFSIRAKS